MKRLTLYIIVVSISFQYAGRSGLLNRLYNDRFDLAVSIGLLSEKPITLCSADSGDTSLSFNDEYLSVPKIGFMGPEFNLFVGSNALAVEAPFSCSQKDRIVIGESLPEHQFVNSPWRPPIVG